MLYISQDIYNKLKFGKQELLFFFFCIIIKISKKREILKYLSFLIILKTILEFEKKED